MAVDPARAKSLFLDASDLADPAERAAYLERECGGDAELRATGRGAARRRRRGRTDPWMSDATGDVRTDLTRNPGSDRGRPDAETRLPSELATAEDRSDGADFTLAGAPRADRPGGSGAGQVIAGRYTLLEVLGEGGMGTVYRAEQTEPVKRQVALKLIKIGMDSRAVLARFDAERQALALMDHPNIARVYDGGTTEAGQPFFVMELVSGVPITDYCDRQRLPVRARLELFVAGLPGGAARPPEGDHPPRPQAQQRAGHRGRRPAHAQGHRLRRRQGDRIQASPTRAWPTPGRSSARRRTCRPSRPTRRRWTSTPGPTSMRWA